MQKIISKFVTSFGAGCLATTLLLPAEATTIQLSPDPRAPQGRYNVQMGSLRLGFTGRLSVGYDDNITSASSSNDTEEGWCVTPALGMAVDWPISPMLQIGSGLELGFKYYPDGSGEDTFLVTGAGGVLDAGINADVHIGNGVIRFSETFARETDTLDTAIQGEKDDYALLRNVLGARYQVDLSEYVRVIASGKHTNAWTNKSDYDYQDHQKENLDLVVLWAMNRRLRLGPYLSWEQYDYTEDKHNDSDGVSAGLAAAYTRGSGFGIDANIGYEKVDFDPSNKTTATDDAENLKGKIRVKLATSEFTRHTLSAAYGSKQGSLSGDTNFSLESKYSYGLAVDLSQKMTAKGDVSYIDTVESDAGSDSVLIRYGLGLEYRFNPLTQASLRLERTEKNDDDDNSDYDRNKIEASLLYRF
jgi:hypothetical protein